MSEWTECTLGDVVTLQRGYDLPSRVRRQGCYPVVSSSGTTDWHAEYKVEGPGVVTGRYGTIGEVFYVAGKYWPLNTTLFVSDFKGNVPRFVYYLLKLFDFKKFSDKSAVPGVNRNDLYPTKIRLPRDRETQESIALALHSLDDKIEHNNELIKMLEEQAQLVYDYWFMQFDFPDENWRPYRSSGGKMVWSEELKREIPEGWSVKPCGEVFGVTRGKSYSSEEIEKGSTLMINLKNLAPYGGYNRNMEKPYSGTFTANHVAKEGDVLMGVTDMTRERRMVGYVLRVPHMEQECVFSMDLIKLLPIAVSPTFLYTSLYYGKYGKKFSPFALGTNVLHLNPTAISRIPFVVPKKQVLELADSIFEGIYEKMDALEAENALLTAQRDFLLPRLMTGEITVAE